LKRRSFVEMTVAAALAPALLPPDSKTWPLAEKPSVYGGVRPETITIAYNPDLSPEVAAAKELRDFLHRMTGKEPQMQAGANEDQCPRGSVWMVVGRTALTKLWISSGVLQDPLEKHREAYVVRSLDKAPGRYVLFLGGTGIATLYAVYDYLENCCKVGFFWDGDHVPSLGLIPVQDVGISTQPYFSERMYMNLCLYWYSVPWWDWEDWRQYIDWTLKSRFNILSLWDTPGEDLLWNKLWKKLGVEISDNSYSGPPYGIFEPTKYGIDPPLLAGWREGQCDLNRKVVQYARSRGMRTVAPAVSGVAPQELARIYPHTKTFQLAWTGLAKQSYVHPSDPLYHRAGKAFLEEYISTYGTDHLYWLENYLETIIDGSKELQEDVRREIAGANFKVVNEVDPQGVGILPGWTYLIFPGKWTPQLVQEHLSRVPADRVEILDFFADVFPLYKQMDYFYRIPWHFGIIHSFAGQTYLHGRMELIEKQVQEVTRDPRAKRCKGFSLLNEVSHHNYFYYQFVVKLGWNPSEVDLPTFTHHYAMTRYGEAAAPTMSEVLQELLKSVYGDGVVAPPLYLHRLGSEIEFRVAENKEYIPHLRRALERALEAGETLAQNCFYLHDLNDITRQYLAELFNSHLLSLIKAQGDLEPVAFDREAEFLDQIMGEIEAVLGYDAYYWLSPYIQKARSLPGAPPDVDVRVRDILTRWAQGKGDTVLRDYACRDYYETVQGYYRPRVRAYIRNMRERMMRGQLTYRADSNMNREYEEIEKKWDAEGFALRETAADPGGLIGEVENILKKWPS